MARTRRYKRHYRSKARYSSNISEFSENEDVNAGSFYIGSVLATNPVQSTLGVSQTYTTKNFEIDFTFESANAGNIEDITAYIMFVPQGMQVTDNFNIAHPEYILSYKYYGSPSGDTSYFQPFRIKSRMARKLNTGDSIILFIKGKNENTSVTSLNVHGVVRWWTKAN